MRIAIDGNEANVTHRVGSNAYAYELLCALEKKTREMAGTSVTVLLAHEKLNDLPPARTNWQYSVVLPSTLWTQYALPLYLFVHRHQYDVLYTPGHYAPRLSRIPYVSSVMDLAFLHFPQQFRRKDLLQLSEWTRYSVRHAAKVIVISEHTKRDVIEQYHLPSERVVVAYPGFTHHQHTTFKEHDTFATLQKWHIRPPYLLYVGTIQPRKNVVRLIEAFEAVSVHNPKNEKIQSLQLVIAGKVGWLASETLQRIKTSPLRKKIIFTGYISETEKAILYSASIGTILVGLYEGFGIPALEAVAYGSIPIVSQTTSLPEVVGNAGILVDPFSVESIRDGIEKLLNLSAQETVMYLKYGRQRLKKFEWEKSADIVLHTLQEVVDVNTNHPRH